MSPENVRERKEKHRYTFVVVPDAKSEKTRTFSISRLGLIGVIIATFIVVLAIVVAAIIYTPIGSSLSLSNSEVEKRYATQIAGIQDQVNSLVRDMSALHSYNIRLRRALGETISSQDSAIAAQQNVLQESQNNAVQQVATNQSSTTVEASSAMQNNRMQGLATRSAEGMTTMNEHRRMDFPLTIPADGYVTQEFATSLYHYGIDFAGRPGTAIIAAADGNVVFSNWTYDYGFEMIIAHDEGYMTVYKHNQSLLKMTGQNVKRGDVIALLGNTGVTSSGPHLHFEVWKDGIAQDPRNYLLNIQ